MIWELAIIEQGCAKYYRYCDLSGASRSINIYSPKPKAEANNNNFYVSINQIWLLFYHLIIWLLINWIIMSNHPLPAQGTDHHLPFSHKSLVSIITHMENIICSKTLSCCQLFAGHVVSSWSMKRKEKIHWMTIIVIIIIIIIVVLTHLVVCVSFRCISLITIIINYY